jgi:hypothetical protein
MLNLPEKAPDHMLEKPNGLLFDQLSDHVTENGPNRVKSFVGVANVSKTGIIK